MGLTVGRIGDRHAGYIHLGNGRSGPELRGALYLNRRHHRHRSSYYYGPSRYFHRYHPIRYYGNAYYEPWYGYRYNTVYFNTPYVHRFYETNVVYVERPAKQVEVYDAASPTPVAAVEGPMPSGAEVYAPLTEPVDNTLVGRGNAAFMAGTYDEARRLYVSAMLADERDGYAKFLYALVNFAMGDYEVAGMAIRRALLTTADLIDYPVDVRVLYPQPLIFDTQREKLIRQVDQSPQDRGALLLLGYLHYAAGEPERALAVLDRLVEIDSDDNTAALLHDAVRRVIRERQPGN